MFTQKTYPDIFAIELLSGEIGQPLTFVLCLSYLDSEIPDAAYYLVVLEVPKFNMSKPWADLEGDRRSGPPP